MAKIKSVFICQECGYESPKWMGKCPDCSSWNTFTEEQVVQQNKSTKEAIKVRQLAKKPIKKLSEVTSSKSDRIVTGISEFDRVMGGGIVKDSITIITARPGAGKSTFSRNISDKLNIPVYHLDKIFWNRVKCILSFLDFTIIADN